MRKYLVVTALLAAVLVGIMAFSAHSMNQENGVQEDLQIQIQQMESKKAQLEQKEQELSVLMEKPQGGEADQEWILLQEEVQQLQSQKEELEAQIQQLQADTGALKEKLLSEDSDQSYFLEVYNALTEGLNNVKGYISGN